MKGTHPDDGKTDGVYDGSFNPEVLAQQKVREAKLREEDEKAEPVMEKVKRALGAS